MTQTTRKIFLIMFFMSFSISSEYYYFNGKKVYLKEIKKSNISRNHDGEEVSIKQYVADDGTIFGVNNHILIQCKQDSCVKQLKGYDIKGSKKITDTYYTVELEHNDRIFEISRRLYKEDYIESAHPDFEVNMQLR